MGEFKCEVPGFDIDHEHLIEYARHLFYPFDPSKWSEQWRGSFQYTDDDGEVWLMLAYVKDQVGIALRFTPPANPGREWLSVASMKKLFKYVELADGSQLPEGCFLSPGRAWQAVEAFLQNPTHRTDKVKWVDALGLDR